MTATCIPDSCTTFPSTAQVVEALQPNTAVVVYDWRNNTLQVRMVWESVGGVGDKDSKGRGWGWGWGWGAGQAPGQVVVRG